MDDIWFTMVFIWLIYCLLWFLSHGLYIYGWYIADYDFYVMVDILFIVVFCMVL